VLIALSVDGVADWRRERRLVREAEDNLRAELRDNKNELERIVAGIPDKRKDIKEGLALATTLLQLIAERGPAGAKAAVRRENVRLNVSFADLSESSRATAEQTGAFGHMKYQEVKRYASVYGSQRKFLELQDRMFAQFALVLPVVEGRIADMATADLDRWRQNLQVLLQHLFFAEQVGRQLVRTYERALAGKS
jgi:hypothetical protein